MTKTKFVALTEQEMRQVTGGCWLCNAWKWLKSHVFGGSFEEHSFESGPYGTYGAGGIRIDL